MRKCYEKYARDFNFHKLTENKQIILLTSVSIKWNQSQLTCLYPMIPNILKDTKEVTNCKRYKEPLYFVTLYPFPLLNLLTQEDREIQMQIYMYLTTYKITRKNDICINSPF